jgi:hypothetical protein
MKANTAIIRLRTRAFAFSSLKNAVEIFDRYDTSCPSAEEEVCRTSPVSPYIQDNLSIIHLAPLKFVIVTIRKWRNPSSWIANFEGDALILITGELSLRSNPLTFS